MKSNDVTKNNRTRIRKETHSDRTNTKRTSLFFLRIFADLFELIQIRSSYEGRECTGDSWKPFLISDGPDYAPRDRRHPGVNATGNKTRMANGKGEPAQI